MPAETSLAELREAIKHEEESFREAAIAVVVGDSDRLAELLGRYPELATASSKSEHGATLLHYVSSNAIEDVLQLHPSSVYNQLQACKSAQREPLIAGVESIVRQLVESGADPDALAGAYGGGSGATPLNWLVSSGHPYVAGVTGRLTKAFCDCGAKPDGVAGDSSPLLTAVAFGITDAIKPLVDAGVRVDNVILAAIVGDAGKLRDMLSALKHGGASALARCQQPWLPVPTDWETSCQWAMILGSMSGQVKCVELLLDAGVDINAKPKISHMTGGALHTASLAGQLGVIDLLVARGADPTIKDDRYSSDAVGWARQGNHVHAIIKVGNYRAQYVRDRLHCAAVDAFIEAVRDGNVDRIKRAVAHSDLSQEHLDAPWFDFDAPAIVFAKRNVEIVDCLVAAGADLNQKSLWWAGGYGVLHESDAAVAEPLIERGAKLDVWSAASVGKYSELVEIVEKDSSSVTARGPDGQTALHCARSVDIANFLIDQGAGLNVRCLDHNSTPLQYALKSQPEVAKLLVDRGAMVDILAACALGLTDVVASQIAEDPDAIRTYVSREYFPSDAADCIYSWTLGWYQTAHQVAAVFGHKELVAFLLEKSPLDVKLLNACLLGDKSLAQELSSDGKLIPNALDGVASHLVHCARNNMAQSVELLLESGFPPGAVGQHGATALHWAAFHGNLVMVENILKHQPPLEALDADYHCTPLAWVRQGRVAGWYRETGQFVDVARQLIHAGCRVDPSWKPTGNDDFDSVFA